jgi:hypothetical protein
MKPWFSDWEPSVYAQYLSYYLGYPLEKIYQPPDYVASYLYDESGNPRYIDFEKHPFLPRMNT